MTWSRPRAVGLRSPRPCRTSLLAGVLALVSLLGGFGRAPAAAAFTSCADVRAYFRTPLPQGAYARVQDLEKAVEVLKRESASPSDSCEDWVMERGFFEYAAALDEYSKTFSGETQATQRWAMDAAAAYDQYVGWFLTLAEASQDQLIRILTKTQRLPDDEFKKEKRKWLRSRVGNVLNSMGASFVRAQAHEQLLSTYERFRETVEIYPNEVTKKWHKWLRAKPDFQVEKREAQIKDLMTQSHDCASRWEAFKAFLDAYIPANPSVQTEWSPIRERIVQWLSR